MATIAAPITVSSTADMMSAAPLDLFAGISDISDTGDTPEDDGLEAADDTIDTPDAPEDTPAPEEFPLEEAAAAPEPAPKADAKTAPAPDELPEGVVKGKDRKGKAGYFLEENRYQTFHGNHKIVQQAGEILGEPLTLDSIKLHNAAYQGQERLFNNLTSGDPAAQKDVLGFMLDEMKGALDKGEVGIDPTVPFAESLYETLQTKSPDGYAHLRQRAANDLVGEMFDTAARLGDLDLTYSAQRFAIALANVGPKPANMSEDDYLALVKQRTQERGTPFYTSEEASALHKPEDKLGEAQRRIAELEARVNAGSRTAPAEQYETWRQNNIKEVNSAVFDDAVKPVLAVVEAGWKQYPDDYKRLVVDPLQREVMKVVHDDPQLNTKIVDLQARARRATSEQVRQQLGAEIRQRITNRAKQAAETTARESTILKFAAEWLQGRSEKNHERRTDAQNRTAPKGPGAPVKTSVLPDLKMPNGIYDPGVAMKQMLALVR